MAVSGGPDSLALLLLAQAAFPGRVLAATVDHGLRPESAMEAAFVADICAARGIAHTTLKVEVGPGNLQDAAREARYGALVDWLYAQMAPGERYAALATAHHAEDQAETLLMRLNRASGLSGLAGVRALHWTFPALAKGIAIIRPLLGWRRAELREVVDTAGIVPVADPSNTDMRFDRARVRAALADCDWIDPLALARSAQHLSEAWQVIESAAAREYEERVASIANGFTYRPGGIRLVGIEVLARVLADMGAQPGRSECARAYDRLRQGENASLCGVLITPAENWDDAAQESGQDWTFRPEPPRRN